MRKILLSTFLICMFFTGYSQVVTSGANQSDINDLLNRVQQNDFRNVNEVFTSSEIAQLKAYYQFENSMKVNLGTPIFGSDAIGDVVAYGFEAFLAPGFSSFDIEAATSVTTISAGIGSEFAGVVSLDNPDLAYSLTNTGSLYSVDVPTGAYTLLGSLGISDMSGMAFNPVNGQLYAISPTALYSINTSVPSATLIGNLGTSQSLAIALAIDGSGTAYTYDIGDDLLYSINLTTGAATSIGSIGFDGNYAQGMDYDPFTDTVYMAAFNVTTFMAELRSVNTTTGMTTLVSNIAGSTAEFTWVSFVSEEEAEYCIPEATNSSRYINNFTATGNDNSISNLASGFSTGGYGDFTATHTVSQAPEGSVDFTADIMGGTAGFRIWVDWNQDGSFDTTEEVAYNSTGYLTHHEGSFIVPTDATEGTTRMRVVSHWLSTTGNVDPCATGFTYGEFEDYAFTVEGGGGGDCEWTVTVSDTGFGDEVSWELRDADSNVLLSGGPYGSGYTDTQTVMSAGPVEFYIETMGTFNDNSPVFTIENENGVILSGGIEGGLEATYSDLNCSDIPPPAPENDDCGDITPTELTNGVSVTFNGTTEGGTASAEEMSVLGNAAVWEAVTLTGDCNDLTIDYCGTPAGNMDGNFFIVYTMDCPVTSFTIGNYDFTTCGDGNGTLRFTGLPAGTYYLPVIVDPSNNNLGDYVMNVISEDCFVPEPPDYPCYQGDGLASNGFENGYNVTAGGTFRNADDFVVDDSFNLQYIRMNLFMSPGATASSATFNIRADESGAPSESTIEETITATPTSQVVIGNNFGFNISQVEFVLDTPVDLSAGTYWLQPEVTASNAGAVYWEVTSTGSLGEYVHSSEAGGPWTSDPETMQAVFFVAGTCDVMADGCFVTGTIDQWPSSTFVPSCSGVVEVITTAGWAGEYSKVQVTAGTEYIFSSSVATDFITIADEDEDIAFATGTGSVTWTSPVDQVIRFYTHLNEDCEIEEVSRSRAVQCGDIQPPPANDDCADAIALACGESDSGSTVGATDSGGNTAGDVFYSFTGTGSSELVTVSLCGSSFDTYLRVYTDCTLATEVAVNDDSCDLQSELTFTSDGTSTYYIMVEGFSANVGDYVIEVNCTPPPSDCEDFEVLSNALENGLFFGGDTAQHIATDIQVADTGFTVYGMEPTLIGEATTISFIFYADNGGLPGAEIGTAEGSIEGSVITGSNFGFDFIKYTVAFDTPFEMEANTTYWIEILSDAVAWETTSASILGYGDVFYNTNVGEGVWTSTGGDEFVFNLICEELGVGDMNSFDFSYYPNPVKDVLNITSKNSVENIAVFNLAGQKVLTDVQVTNGQVNVSALPSGVYVFKATLQGGQIETFKIVKK
ncbi:GEVED domain-containing protein [Moheibacter lacus]|uniref:T9SS type A sorting domain-containing protein n=1 Tax=Moheibacter lacus TaxID=2745851 RepID=A0A838ZH92_9FLAO|nr:GEVED domain-containing protein [Moheibacter lacus]MBA5628628.1 T9SS type A sorting domain-containing protein [Moheibacter lacus]